MDADKFGLWAAVAMVLFMALALTAGCGTPYRKGFKAGYTQCTIDVIDATIRELKK